MNLERIEAILKLLQRQDYVGEVSVEGEGWRLHARKMRGLATPGFPETETLSETVQPPQRLAIRAGLVGVYREPDRPLRLGDYVAPGTVVGNIDSMRILNPVVTEDSGYVVDVLAEDGDPVEYGQELFALSAELPAREGAE